MVATSTVFLDFFFFRFTVRHPLSMIKVYTHRVLLYIGRIAKLSKNFLCILHPSSADSR